MKLVIYLGAAEGHEAAVAALEGVAKVQHVPAEQSEVAAALRVADGLLDASMKIRITDDMISAAPNLKIISCATTGSDHIARAALETRGIPVRTLKEDPDVLRNITPAAEHSWALLMACARKLPSAVSHVSAGGWTREEFPGVMLKGKKLGLVGCGRIGGWMSRYAHAFGMEIIGFDPHLPAFPDTISPRSLEEVVTTSEFVSIHVHLSPETEGLVSRDLVRRMKPGAILINTSRGGIVDEVALYEGIESGLLGGAGLDVLKGEPETADHPLVTLSRTHPNLLITPHCGGFSPDAVRVVCAHAASKIRTMLQSTAT